jgi:prepilin-type N-terminal cleavage/methylation domain-containing protein
MKGKFQVISCKLQEGFTLIEVLVVASITVLITGFLVVNFSRSRIDLNQVTVVIADAIREAQSLALSGSLIQGTYRCGYGVHFTSNGYLIYAGPDSQAVDCSVQNRDYNGGDIEVRQGLLPGTALEIVPPSDIFFEPPNPTTYIGGSNAPGATATVIIRRKGAQCPGADCRRVTVTTAGQIQTQ